MLQSHCTTRGCPGQELDPSQPSYLIYLQSPQPFIPSVTLSPRQQYQSHHDRETGYWAYHGADKWPSSFPR